MTNRKDQEQEQEKNARGGLEPIAESIRMRRLLLITMLTPQLILDDEETLDFRKVHVGLFDFAPR